MSVQDDLAWFEANRQFIAQNYSGQWVLIKDKAIKGAFPTDSAAMTAGYQMFGAQPFVVKQALAQEKVHQVPTK
jgi:hypothetical protein